MNNINNTVAHKKNERHTFGNIENHKMQFSDLSIICSTDHQLIFLHLTLVIFRYKYF